MTFASSILDIKGVGPVLAEKLAKIGLTTAGDVLNYFPRRYDNYNDITTIKSMMPGLVTLVVSFENISKRRVSRGLHVTQADAVDATGKVRVVWFNQPYRADGLSDKPYVLRGMYEFKNKRLQIINPSIELQSDMPSDDTTILPTYTERGGIKNHQFRRIAEETCQAINKIPEILPPDVINQHDLLPRIDAYRAMHRPANEAALAAARRRFAFEELFVVMLATSQQKTAVDTTTALSLQFDESSAKEFVARLPFTLTDDQRAAAWQILKDMQQTKPMNRLLEGDVGSGKTVVAAMAALMALENSCQVALIAPTEILARQHFKTLQTLLAHTNFNKDIELLIGSSTKTTKQQTKQNVLSGQAKLVVGTHALLEKDINWQKLALVIIDEQHRFGVKQRQHLHTKAGYMPHILCMTATPIPRSLALTVYGELDISIIHQKPVGRIETTTRLVSPNSLAQMYSAVATSLKAGRQAYIVCPLIAESELLNVSSAKETYESLRKTYFKDFKLGLLHGRMKPADKDAVMQAFQAGDIDALVATTVIEVGVDVPNATDMVILGADRFGLAQLHQLRGRIGRGQHGGSCYLVMSDSLKPSRRMQAITSTNDGFKLAEYDLEIRGPGAIYGTLQHGALDLRHVQLSDHALIAEVRQAADSTAKAGDYMLKYTELAEKISKTLQLTYLN